MPVSNRSAEMLQEFLGSAHVFATAVDQVVERRLLEEVAGKEVSLSQFRLLKMVAQTDAQTITDVALFLGVSSAAASKAVDKLVRRRLLSRTEGQPDRREIRLALTQSSRRLLAAYDRRKQRKLGKIFRQFPAEELLRTAKLLDRLSAELVDHHDHGDETCLQCGIYFRDRCLVRQLVQRNCFYLRNKSKSKRAAQPTTIQITASTS